MEVIFSKKNNNLRYTRYDARESGRALFNMLQFHEWGINSTGNVSIPRMAYQFHEYKRADQKQILYKNQRRKNRRKNAIFAKKKAEKALKIRIFD